MKTTVVPAQITTVEDRIAGNFTFIQIFLLIVALIVGTIIYAITPPQMKLGSIKLSVIVFQFLVFGGLAIRINGKIVADWLVTYVRYSKRPRYYVFTKNDELSREKYIATKEPKVVTGEQKQVAKSVAPSIPADEQARVTKLLTNPTVTVSFELAKKGGIDVSLTPVKE